MSDTAQRTESMRRYAAELGAADELTTARMRARLDDYLEGRQARRRRIRWIFAVASVVAVVGIATQLATDGAPTGVIATGEQTQAIELPGARLQLGPGTDVRLSEDADGVAIVELMGGSVTLDAHAGQRIVRCGEHRVRTDGAILVSVERTPGMPVVKVTRGRAVLRGPGLPADGVAIIPTD